MATDSLFQTKLALIQLDCPALSASDLKILEEEHATGTPHKKRAFWKIDREGEAAYQKIADYTPHQIYYLYLLRLAERDKQLDRDTRLGVPSAGLDQKDYDFWCKADYWELTEFIGLLIGRSPQQIAPYLREGGPTTTQLAEDIYSLKLLLDRSLVMRKLDYHPSPRDLLQWAKDKRIELPAMLKSAAEKHGLLSNDDQTASLDDITDQNVVSLRSAQSEVNLQKPGQTKEIESLTKMVIGMALEQYDYDPLQKKNDAPRNISDDLSHHGINLDKDTIRKYLKRGVELLPRDEKPNSLGTKPNSKTA